MLYVKIVIKEPGVKQIAHDLIRHGVCPLERFVERMTDQSRGVTVSLIDQRWVRHPEENGKEVLYFPVHNCTVFPA